MPRFAGWLIAFPVVIGAGLIATWWVLARSDAPWVFVALIWLTLNLMGAYFSRASAARTVFINLGALMLGLGCAEVWFAAQIESTSEERYEGGYTDGYFVDHELLGYGPAADRKITVRRFVSDTLVYDTLYSIGANGLRATPAPAQPKSAKGALFFGGSVTFGEGVADDESMPYRVGELTRASHRVYNFGFHGYGPHQMLAALEFGLVESLINEEISHVVYQAIPSHVARVAGLAHWDRHGPAYVTKDGGDLGYAGPFDADRSQLLNLLLPSLARSSLYQSIFGIHRALKSDDIELYVAIVESARDLVHALWPGSEFHVLLWGYRGDRVFDEIYAGFLEANIRVHLISDILPAYNRTPAVYQIGVHDRHPNALTHGLIAAYVRDNVLNIN